jgi:argininosuccinate synthase
MRIVLAYSGSLEGSAAIQWLRDRHSAEIVAVTLDLGQGRELEVIRDRALAIGAQRAHVLDTRDEFARDYVVPALRADALHEGRVPMALALSRPLIARKILEIAAIERADAVAHTGHATGGVSQLDRLLAALEPALQVITPARSWTVSSADLLAFARASGLATAGGDSARIESNFWGRSLRQPFADGEPASLVARAPEMCPAEPAYVDIAFVRGVPTALNGVVLPLTELVASLGMLAAAHGVGHIRNERLLCAAPAAVLLHTAHDELTRKATSPEVEPFSAAASLAYVDLIEGARWFSPLREGLDAYFGVVQACVNGHVRLRLFKGEYSTVTSELMQTPVDTPSALRPVPLSAQH